MLFVHLVNKTNRHAQKKKLKGRLRLTCWSKRNDYISRTMCYFGKMDIEKNVTMNRYKFGWMNFCVFDWIERIKWVNLKKKIY